MADGELVPEDVSRAEYLDESHLRMCRAGYCNRDGGPIPRKVQVRATWGKRRLNVWPRDTNGRLIGD